MSLREAAALALEALENARPVANEDDFVGLVRLHHTAICTLRTALAESPDSTKPVAEPEQKPVAIQHRKPIVSSDGETLGYTDWQNGTGLEWWPRRSLYTHPAPQPVTLTDEEIMDLVRKDCVNMRWPSTALNIARAVIEAYQRKQEGKV